MLDDDYSMGRELSGILAGRCFDHFVCSSHQQMRKRFFFHVRVSEWARAGSCGGNIILQYIFYDIIYLYKDNSL
jgi:hypothetical protein